MVTLWQRQARGILHEFVVSPHRVFVMSFFSCTRAKPEKKLSVEERASVHFARSAFSWDRLKEALRPCPRGADGSTCTRLTWRECTKRSGCFAAVDARLHASTFVNS